MKPTTAITKFLAQAEQTYSARVWAYYSAQSERLGFKSSDEIQIRIATLSKRASWLLALAAAKNSTAKTLGFTDKIGLMKSALSVFKEQNLKPSTVSSLIKTLSHFKIGVNHTFETALDSLISRKVGNTNAKRELSNEQKGLILDLFLKTNKLKTSHKAYLQEAKRRIEAGIWSDASIISLSVLKSTLKDFGQRITPT